jgi:hypothetical protein
MVIMVVMARWSQESPVYVGQLGEVEEMEISGGGDSYSYGATVNCGILAAFVSRSGGSKDLG